MATAAFKSTTRRTPVGNSSEDSSSSARNSAHRRSRSLSRFSRRLPEPELPDQITPVPSTRGKFVTKVRGSDFPEISLDDLAIELFDSSLRGRASLRDVDVSPTNGGAGGETVAQRRGRSVSRVGPRGSVGNSGVGGRAVPDRGSSRNRRSLSVMRYPISDSESDLDSSRRSRVHDNMKSITGTNNQMPSKNRPTASNQRRVLRRSVSQRDLKCQDGYSSHSSALTDDEGKDAHYNRNGHEKTIRAVYSKKKMEHPTGDDVNSGLYEVMRTELRHAVKEIKTELENGRSKTKNSSLVKDSDILQAVSTITRNYTSKLEQSEKRKQDLLAEILLEEQRGRELSKIVKDLLPDQRNTVVERPARARKSSNDRNRMSKRLTEEAEKYIEDFISNVEDTDISSLDGERSDTSSTLGGIPAKANSFQSPAITKSMAPVEMDGVVLPWLQWETSNDVSPLSCKNKTSAQCTSSRGSWSPGPADWLSINDGKDLLNSFGEGESCGSKSPSKGSERLKMDVEDYLNLKSEEDFLYERWNQRNRISSGGFVLCNCNHIFL